MLTSTDFLTHLTFIRILISGHSWYLFSAITFDIQILYIIIISSGNSNNIKIFANLNKINQRPHTCISNIKKNCNLHLWTFELQMKICVSENTRTKVQRWQRIKTQIENIAPCFKLFYLFFFLEGHFCVQFHFNVICLAFKDQTLIN